jgi:BirA family biotin operon repressor/biotin-[acetyl-CoA-carboxylase] ligase
VTPPRPLETAAVERAIGAEAMRRIERIDYAVELESTNRFLLEQQPPAPGLLRVALAEHQTGGRGRRGRRWIMPPGAGIALSVAWQFERKPAALTALSLAVGAAARRAIGDSTGVDVGLKWPNDLILDGGKLGGILVELDAPADGGCHVVAGIGLNIAVPADCLADASDFRHGARNLAPAVPGQRLDRSVIAGALIARLVELFVDFAATGFEPYRTEWLAAHVLEGEPVTLDSPAGIEAGTVRGIEADGALVVEDAGGTRRRILSGDVTVRATA